MLYSKKKLTFPATSDTERTFVIDDPSPCRLLTVYTWCTMPTKGADICRVTSVKQNYVGVLQRFVTTSDITDAGNTILHFQIFKDGAYLRKNLCGLFVVY